MNERYCAVCFTEDQVKLIVGYYEKRLAEIAQELAGIDDLLKQIDKTYETEYRTPFTPK